MSSFLRRIQRQVVETKFSPVVVNGEFKGWTIAPPRGVFFNKRGSRLGISNPDAKDLLARMARENKKKGNN